MPADFAVIFDVDGVLIDSYRPHFRSWQLLAEEEGRTYGEDDFVAGFGRTSREVLADQWDDGTFTEAEIARLDDRKETLYRELLAAEFPAMDGAADLIHELSGAGVPIALGSSGPPENVALVVERLGIADCLQAVVTGADVTVGKPDPQVFLIAAERLGVPAGNCLVIEDSVSGIRAAHAAGMPCIAVVSTGHTAEELTAAELQVMSLSELNHERVRHLIRESISRR